MNVLSRLEKLPSGSCLYHNMSDDGNEMNVVDMFKLLSVPLINISRLSI